MQFTSLNGTALAVFAALAAIVAVALTAAVSFAPTAGAQQVVARGDAIGDSPLVDLAAALADPAAYAGEQVVLEGTVVKACQMKGCWMELTAAGAARGIRVTFKDYGFFVPTDSAGQAARLEGTFETNFFSPEDADHLIEEGVSLVRNPDGTATELSFVASGVELRIPAAGQ